MKNLDTLMESILEGLLDKDLDVRPEDLISSILDVNNSMEYIVRSLEPVLDACGKRIRTPKLPCILLIDHGTNVCMEVRINDDNVINIFKDDLNKTPKPRNMYGGVQTLSELIEFLPKDHHKHAKIWSVDDKILKHIIDRATDNILMKIDLQ